ncbi:MAG: lipopolysaccharide biosynthesis protein [Nostoc sp. DedSLP03]|uniref:lipopolysaccharide biosynthesis protein n=1 Tax=Nostoc sp. DedSLP03 TaxID=3075400 RepID=UPI002AD445F7|nr:lipopolysaccharide biosynthesis protein [Nostoc sp. DedSLP03]MDZ7964610.1 lipopolysaccharide biosynthesis protein [Nostoc sp. DedSLP03]
MLIKKLRQKVSSQYLRNIGWMGGAELANRVFRLGTTIILSHLLNPYDYGLIAIVLTTNEFATVFTLRAGIGSKIIQASEKDLKIICQTSYWLNWILCGVMFIIQCTAAFPIAWFYSNNQVILPICMMALVYLMLPIFAVQSALIQRENRLKIIALCNATQSFLINILTIGLALLGMGMWAVVVPIIITTPVWIVINLMNHPWRPTMFLSFNKWQEVVSYARNILGVELLNKLRANLDYLIIGRFLGIQALGIYYFAFNAGLGISMNVINTMTWSLYPHLCAARGNVKQLRERYFSSLKTFALIVFPLVLLQSSLAPFYVPIIFGQKWITAIPVLIVICLSAIPRPFADGASMLLNSVDKSHINLYWNLIFTVIFTISLLVAVKWGIFWVAVAVFMAHILALPLYSIWASKYVLSRTQSLSVAK